MTCNSCHQGEMVPTQVPRVSQGLGVLFGAMRAFAEKKVWRCRECSSVVDRV